MQYSCHNLAGILAIRKSGSRHALKVIKQLYYMDCPSRIYYNITFTQIFLTMLAVAVCIPVRKKSSPKERAMHRLRWTKLCSF